MINMKMSILLQIVASVALALLLFFGVQTIIESRVVEGSSMEVGLHDGQRLIVVKAAYWFGEPQRGDVVIFTHPLDPERTLVKRVIGLPGEHIEITDSIVYIDGSQLLEPYVKGTTSPLSNTEVPPGCYFVMGDNRQSSSDSRSWGPLPEDNIIGRAWLLYWPLEDWHLIDSYSYAN
ncbi:MAG: signal peptidase I [Dehalococcoidia bacterium]|jgi:signal peptidase I